MDENDLLTTGPDSSSTCFLFAHGAGAPMDSPFMNEVASQLGQAGIVVERFEFPYMAARRSGKKKGPDRPAVLLETWRSIIEEAGGARRLFIGGKSMGGRIASMVADEAEVDGVVCFGYPFHPPGRPERLRTAHLASIKTPVLIVQGERDPFGKPEEVADYALSSSIKIEWIPDGDHSFKPRKRSGHTLESNLSLATRLAIDFMTS